MKVTPLEIRQKIFEKTLRGYNKEEVSVFLHTLSLEWERMQNEVQELRIRLSGAEKEVSKLREVEDSLYKTLKTAEDTGVNVVEQANKQAELKMKEAQLQAEEIVANAKTKARDALESSEAMSKKLLNDMESQLQQLVQNYKNMSIIKEGLIDSLKRVADETIQKTERIKSDINEFDSSEYLLHAKREAERTLQQYETSSPDDDIRDESSFEEKKDVQNVENENTKSFFDDI